jgi:hypothetical protein
MKTPENIMTEYANSHSYESWDELMFDSHSFYQIECTKGVMIEFARQMTQEIWHEMDLEILQPFDQWWNEQMSKMTKITKNN